MSLNSLIAAILDEVMESGESPLRVSRVPTCPGGRLGAARVRREELRLGSALNWPPFATGLLRSAESPPTIAKTRVRMLIGLKESRRSGGWREPDDQQSPHLLQTGRAGEASITCWHPRSQRLQDLHREPAPQGCESAEPHFGARNGAAGLVPVDRCMAW